ncbi:hypothetical protein [Pyrococcus kukulkanii]|uniref:hypothetical protein n=1 Tax=Pyrococcus kukulkanii TaxID=1609559 RepID=UPI00356A5505
MAHLVEFGYICPHCGKAVEEDPIQFLESENVRLKSLNVRTVEGSSKSWPWRLRI